MSEWVRVERGVKKVRQKEREKESKNTDQICPKISTQAKNDACHIIQTFFPSILPSFRRHHPRMPNRRHSSYGLPYLHIFGLSLFLHWPSSLSATTTCSSDHHAMIHRPALTKVRHSVGNFFSFSFTYLRKFIDRSWIDRLLGKMGTS